MNGIKPGDVVELKSGGPDMTVERLYDGGNGEQRAACSWFEGNKHISGNFPVAALKPASKAGS
jgi:uncharacterized protein YodC (DUF2158 family)